MLCRKCSSEYVPTPEEERLILKKDLVPLCPACAPTPHTHKVPIELPVDERHPVLWRAERTDISGKIIAFMRTPKVAKQPTTTPLVKPRADRLHVFVMSEGNPQRMSSAPRVILHTNIETFINDKQNFWVNKLPSFWDGATGISRIEVKNEDVVDVIRESSLTRIRCQDGSEVRLHYE